MEVRRLLSTVVVDTFADETVANGTTSLRDAMRLPPPVTPCSSRPACPTTADRKEPDH
jgi:hypothetical protein